jgi:hypothetical protein
MAYLKLFIILLGKLEGSRIGLLYNVSEQFKGTGNKIALLSAKAVKPMQDPVPAWAFLVQQG